MSGAHIVTRPIKGTRPRDADPTRDAQFAYELQTSAKELAELVMITDLLRNDLGKVCEYGSVQVPELARLENLRRCSTSFPPSKAGCPAVAGSRILPRAPRVFRAQHHRVRPKFRAMEIIDELEPVSRGPYCGAIGLLGFNRKPVTSPSAPRFAKTASRMSTSVRHRGRFPVRRRNDETWPRPAGMAALNLSPDAGRHSAT